MLLVRDDFLVMLFGGGWDLFIYLFFMVGIVRFFGEGLRSGFFFFGVLLGIFVFCVVSILFSKELENFLVFLVS